MNTFYSSCVSAILLISFWQEAISAPSENAKIMGGNPTTILQYPHQVSVRELGRHVCGGSIVSKKHVVTAAHCVEQGMEMFMSVMAGSTYLDNGHNFEIRDIYIHPKFDWYTGIYDIAIIRLVDSLEFSDKIYPIELSNEEPRANDFAHVIGWGNTGVGSSFVSTLQEAYLKVIGNEDCQKYFDNIVITEQMFCGGDLGTGGGVCHGDDGGPMIISDSLAGIVSFRYNRCKAIFPGVFTKISAVRDFIDETMERDFESDEREMLQRKNNGTEKISDVDHTV